MNSKLVKDIDFYLENDKLIFTKNYLIKRGYCCNSKPKCRYCPYKNNMKILHEYDSEQDRLSITYSDHLFLKYEKDRDYPQSMLLFNNQMILNMDNKDNIVGLIFLKISTIPYHQWINHLDCSKLPEDFLEFLDRWIRSYN